MLKLNIEKTLGFISKESVSAYEAEVKAAQEALEKGTRPGNDFLGWLHLPSSITAEHLADLNATAQVLRENCEVVLLLAYFYFHHLISLNFSQLNFLLTIFKICFVVIVSLVCITSSPSLSLYVSHVVPFNHNFTSPYLVLADCLKLKCHYLLCYP